MNTLQIQNFSVDELKTIIEETVEKHIQSLIPKPKPELLYLTRKETANKLGVSLVTLHKWTKDGVLKGHHINTRVRYRNDEVERAFRVIESTKNRI